MKKKKKRKIRVGALLLVIAVALIPVVLIGLLISSINFRFLGARSLNADAAKYKTKHCLLFYPKNADKDLFKGLCEGKEDDEIIDYTETPRGETIYVEYPDGTSWYFDPSFKEIELSSLSEQGKVILSDYVRYEAKKNHPEVYYEEGFLKDTAKETIGFSKEQAKLQNDHIVYTIPEHGLSVDIPISCLSGEIGIDLGIRPEPYVKKRYVDKDRPMVALTFDDGPYSPVGQGIVDILDEYDGAATFFVVGNRLSTAQLEFVSYSISRGNQYGSHTSDHADLNKVDGDTAVYQVMNTVDYLKEKTGYQMTVYRSPYGSHNSYVSQATGLRDILWNVDSLDWNSRSVSAIKEKVMSETDDHDVILFHELYSETGAAIKDLVPWLVEQGYQLVTVDELMEALDYSAPITNTFSGK